MSAWAISRVPLRSAGLSGSAGSAASRSHSTRSALWAWAGGSNDATVGARSQRLKAQAIERAPDRFILTMTLHSVFVARNDNKATTVGLQAQAGRCDGALR